MEQESKEHFFLLTEKNTQDNLNREIDTGKESIPGQVAESMLANGKKVNSAGKE